MARIFISHSSADQQSAETLKAWLHSIGFEHTFLDFDKHTGIPPGADWERMLYREIERAQAVILILTKNWFASKWCFAEFTQTRALGKAIYALIETPSGETTVVSADIQHLDLTTNREEGLDRLSRELTRVALNAQGGFPWEEGRAPYPGLMSFEGEDAAIFFGRDDDVLRAIERINARRVQGGAKLLAILGASGSGKSSLLKAGVLPRLARDKKNFLVAPPFRPGSDPMRALHGALLSIDPSLGRAELEAVSTADDAAALIDRLRLAAKATQATLIVAIDQAEEIFTRQNAERQNRFLKLLSTLCAEDHPVLGILTMRSDHVPQLQLAEGLSVGFEEFSLKPMPIERVGMIVKGPARIASLTAEDSLVAALMRDTKSQDALPLVAFILRRLYDRHRSDGVLSAAHYESLRDGELSPLEVAVRDAATEAIERTKPSQAELDSLREAFVPALVRVNEEGAFLRQSARLDQLPLQAQGLLRQLDRARLLVIDTFEGATTVEVAHEALFRVWPLLAQWLEEEREFLVGKSRIEKSLEDHDKLSEPARVKGLLSGILLERAKAWLLTHPRRFSSEEAAYIGASVQEAERQEKERAAERERLRQLELTRAKEQAQHARRLLYFAASAAVLFAVLGGIAVKFWFDADAAQREAKTNFNLAINQAAANVDLIVDNYQAGRIATRLLKALIERAQKTVDDLHSDTAPAAAAKAKLLRAVSRAYLVLSQTSKALEKGEEGLAVTGRYLAAIPADQEWMALDERAREQVAQTFYWKGDLAKALSYLQTAEETAQALANRYADNKDHQQDLIEIYRFAGDALRNQGRIDEASVQYRKWLDLADRLAAKEPGETLWLRDQMFAHQRMGDVLLAQAKPAEAEIEFRVYLELAVRGVGAESDNKEFTEAVEIAHERIGDSLFARDDLAGALEEYTIFLSLSEKLATADESNFIWNQNREIAHQRLGEVYLRQNNYELALGEFRKYMQMTSDTLEKDQDNGTAIFDVTNAMEKVGDALFGQKNYADALEQYRGMQRYALALKQKDASNGIWNKALAISYQRLGLTFEAIGDTARARENFAACAAIAVPTVLWNLRELWPADVNGYCRTKL